MSVLKVALDRGTVIVPADPGKACRVWISNGSGLLTDPISLSTTRPGVASIHAAAFAAHSLPIQRFPAAENLASATGLAPALYQSATLYRRGGSLATDWLSTDALIVDHG